MFLFSKQMYSLDGRLSLQSLSEFESSRSWITETVLAPDTPPPQQLAPPTTSQENSDNNSRYMGISLPRKLRTIFPEISSSNILHKVNRFRSNCESRQPQVK